MRILRAMNYNILLCHTRMTELFRSDTYFSSDTASLEHDKTLSLPDRLLPQRSSLMSEVMFPSSGGMEPDRNEKDAVSGYAGC